MEENSIDKKSFLGLLKVKIANKENYKLIEETIIKHGKLTKRIDAILYVDDSPFAIFEFKTVYPLIDNHEIIRIYEFLNVECRYFIVTDGIQFTMYDVLLGLIHQNLGEEASLNELFTPLGRAEVLHLKKLIVAQANVEIEDFILELQDNTKDSTDLEFILKLSKLRKSLIDLRNNFGRHLKYNKEARYFYLTKDIRELNDVENLFFKSIIEDIPAGSEIFRYTTLESLFKTLEVGSLRVSGIVGMNDISEVGYVEGYLNKKFKPMDTPALVKSINKKYIMCSSMLDDDLMQWRLYGDDCKGACLVFKVNDGPELPGLLLRKINYGVKMNGENYHPELDFIKRLKDRLRQKLNIEFQFRTLSLWRHFFKSYEYGPEKEVRLLVIENESNNIKGERHLVGNATDLAHKWNLTSSHKILAPFISMNIDHNYLRCKLEKIILGSKCPELEVNLKQFKLFSNERKINVEIESSKINNYR